MSGIKRAHRYFMQKQTKILARNLSGMPRLAHRYKWHQMPTETNVHVDSKFAGWRGTRRSTSGGIAVLGNCCVKHWSKTQKAISLGSGEPEWQGIAQGAGQALGIQSLLKDALEP